MGLSAATLSLPAIWLSKTRLACGCSDLVPIGGFFIKDAKSSSESGTFLNHIRFSPANSEIQAHKIRDGNIRQRGVGYRGGREDMYKIVKWWGGSGRLVRMLSSTFVFRISIILMIIDPARTHPIAGCFDRRRSCSTNRCSCEYDSKKIPIREKDLYT